MKISINELKGFTEIDLPVEVLVKKIGAQLGEVEEVVNLGEKYKGIIIAKVTSCEKHPNADKLSVCKIDNGKEEIQVVCGAPNAREGLLVAWLPPGATVPATFDKDPLVLESREIRGQVSNGMLASASELGLSDDHSGILEISIGQPGDDFAKTFGLDDYIIDIENKMFTHRPDCFGLLGIAREISGIQGKKFSSPDWYLEAKPEHARIEELVSVKNELPELVPRFMVQIVQNIEVKPSPLWLQSYLSKIGMKPINNVVDITNYVMHLTGQPLHAFDYDKVKARSNSGAAIVIRHPKKGEKIKLLNGKEIEPRSQAIMIATDKESIGIGGVMGGSETEVDQNTKNIIIECANFDLYSIRRTSMTHGLFTDAVTRFSKGQSPLQNDRVLAFAVKLMNQETGGLPSPSIYDFKNNLEDNPAVQVSAEFVNSRLGLDLSTDEIVNLLHNVEFIVEVTRGEVLIVKPPFWRTDVEIAEDVVEEIGRLYGYDNLEVILPKRIIVPKGPEGLLRLKSELRQKLASYGANEVLTYSFVHGNLLDRTGQDKSLAFNINNALSPSLHYYRLSLTPNLLEKIHPNIKAGYDEFAIFEIGKVHGKKELDENGLPREFGRLSLVYSGQKVLSGTAYFTAKNYLGQVCSHNVIPYDEKLIKDFPMLRQMAAPYNPERSGFIWNGKMPAGIVGEYKPEVITNLKLPKGSAGFEVFLSAINTGYKNSYRALPRFPSIHQDITLKTPSDTTYSELYAIVDEALGANAPDDTYIQLEPLAIYQKQDDSNHKHTSFRVSITAENRTLTDKEISRVIDFIASEAAQKINAVRI